MAYDNIHLKNCRERIAREGETKTQHTVVQRVQVNGELIQVTVPLYTENGTHHYRRWEDVWEQVRACIDEREELAAGGRCNFGAPCSSNAPCGDHTNSYDFE